MGTWNSGDKVATLFSVIFRVIKVCQGYTVLIYQTDQTINKYFLIISVLTNSVLDILPGTDCGTTTFQEPDDFFYLRASKMEEVSFWRYAHC